MKGIFITLEGPDGSGKTTQINFLNEYLRKKGYEVILTREPGGTIISERIRQIILDINHKEMSDMTEALLYASARAQHVDQVIKPALNEGKIVICDRFVDSSIAYQGLARGIGMELIESINKFATNGIIPDITILLDIKAELGIKRKKSQAELDRLEVQKLEFHNKVCEGYKILAQNNKDRIKVIDGTKSIDQIRNQVISLIDDILINKNYN